MSFLELCAAADLDEAVQSDPQNAQIWITRGLVYERVGDKTKAADSYGRAINLRPKDEAARSGFIRVGGKPGQSYDTFRNVFARKPAADLIPSGRRLV
jgi:Tfp pilus assembly protein PilF